MNFIDEINELEKITSEEDFIVKKGNVPILFSVPHDIKQHLENGEVKKRTFYKSNCIIFN